jgi:Bacitracin resistance protein BacA
MGPDDDPLVTLRRGRSFAVPVSSFGSRVVHQLSWLEAIVIGALQGVSELFPVSSLGHSVLLPAVVGGSWAQDLDVGAPESPYLAFIVGLHVATALALIVFFWRDWGRIVRGLITSIVRREVVNSDAARMAARARHHPRRVSFGGAYLSVRFLTRYFESLAAPLRHLLHRGRRRLPDLVRHPVNIAVEP